MDSFDSIRNSGMAIKRDDGRKFSANSGKRPVDNQVNYIFNAFYKEQVAALYRQVIRGH